MIRLFILAVSCLCPAEACRLLDFSSCTSGSLRFKDEIGFSSLSLSPPSICLFVIGFCLFWTFLVGPLSVYYPHDNYWDRTHFKFLVLWGAGRVSHAMPLARQNQDEEARASRRAGNVLQADRVVLQRFAQH